MDLERLLEGMCISVVHLMETQTGVDMGMQKRRCIQETFRRQNRQDGSDSRDEGQGGV